MNNAEYKKIGINTIMLYFLTAAKIVFPLITLPYLTRVLSVECYGVVSYVKSIIAYVQLIIDFGFIFSSVKDIVYANGDKKELSKIVCDTIFAKLILVVLSFIAVVVVSYVVPILRQNRAFFFFSFVPPFLSCFLLDYLYRGLEKMHLVSAVFVSMKTVSTVLTFIFVKMDSDILLIPLFDSISSLVAIMITLVIAYKFGIRLKRSSFLCALKKIRQSCFYFTNSIASTAFGALNTVWIGICIVDLQSVAYWSVCNQLIGAVQALYTPISNGIYPYMVRRKNISLIYKVIVIFMPVVILGTILCYYLAPFVLTLISGEQYATAANVFRILLPVLIASFPVAILGLPTLGAIEKVKQVNISTILGALTQVFGLVCLSFFNIFTIQNVAIVRNASEIVMLVALVAFVIKYRDSFIKSMPDL